MKAQPLIIDADPTDIHVGPSSLELRNNSAVERGLAHNRQLRQSRLSDSRKILRRDAEVGAEYIVRKRDQTRTTKLDEVQRHYFGN
jgi:hypothetical protein